MLPAGRKKDPARAIRKGGSLFNSHTDYTDNTDYNGTIIIIKTKNGDKFVNDKEIIELSHDKEKATVTYTTRGGFATFKDVEAILYTNDAQPTSWKDEGSELERLIKSCNERREISERQAKELKAVKDDFLHFAHDMAELVNKYHDQIPDEIKKQIRPRADDLKSKILNHGYEQR